MFASKGITEHLFRGALGIGAFALAARLGPEQPWILLLAMPVALVALRGCPMCWTVGLVQTIAAKIRGRPTEGHCHAGSCAVRPSGGEVR